MTPQSSHATWNHDSYTTSVITVAEVLEFEFCFELATLIGISPKQLIQHKTVYSNETNTYC